MSSRNVRSFVRSSVGTTSAPRRSRRASFEERRNELSHAVSSSFSLPLLYICIGCVDENAVWGYLISSCELSYVGPKYILCTHTNPLSHCNLAPLAGLSVKPRSRPIFPGLCLILLTRSTNVRFSDSHPQASSDSILPTSFYSSGFLAETGPAAGRPEKSRERVRIRRWH